MKIAVISKSVPPSPSGQARVLGRILDDHSEWQALYISTVLPDSFAKNKAANQTQYFHLTQAPLPARESLRSPLDKILRVGTWFAGGLLKRVLEIQKVLGQHPVDIVLGCSGDRLDILASALAARWHSLPFVVYLFDDPVMQWEGKDSQALARFCERIWSRLTHLAIAPNEVLLADFQARVPNVKTIIVRNPALSAAFLDGPDGPNQPMNSQLPYRILYTGSVYHAQGDSFVRLVQALNELNGEFQLHIYTSQSEDSLAVYGLGGKNVFRHDHVDEMAALELQRHADLLFLPLAFHSSIQEVICSSAPAKLGEYLACGRPILVHAPAASFVSQFFNERKCGRVVDEASVALLVSALQTFKNEPKENAEMAMRAKKASGLFRAEAAKTAFAASLRSLLD